MFLVAQELFISLFFSCAQDELTNQIKLKSILMDLIWLKVLRNSCTVPYLFYIRISEFILFASNYIFVQGCAGERFMDKIKITKFKCDNLLTPTALQNIACTSDRFFIGCINMNSDHVCMNVKRLSSEISLKFYRSGTFHSARFEKLLISIE